MSRPYHTTAHEPIDYLHSLAMDPADAEFGVQEVSAMDGCVMYKVGSENHYVLMVCTDHVHKGADVLLRVMPQEWVEFYRVENVQAGFRAYHFGPVLSPLVADEGVE